jgi:hypothetical protein
MDDESIAAIEWWLRIALMASPYPPDKAVVEGDDC